MTTPGGRTVCLCMIVRDEAPVIRACLARVRPLIDHWVVVETGSTDGTQGIVRDALANLPGDLVERPWRDFAHNRSVALALALARPHGTYSLIVDADDWIDVPAGYALPELSADSYSLDIMFGESLSRRARAAGIAQYFDNRQVYGYITLDDADPGVIAGQLERSRRLLSVDSGVEGPAYPAPYGSWTAAFGSGD